MFWKIYSVWFLFLSLPLQKRMHANLNTPSPYSLSPG